MRKLTDPNYIKIILDTGDAKLLDSAIYWSRTKEGVDYWHGIYIANKLTPESRIKLLKMYQEHMKGEKHG